MARNGELAVVTVVSQAQDLAEVAGEIGNVAQVQGRWLMLVSVFLDFPDATAKRRIDRTVWFRMDHDFSGARLDPRG